jgi:hypothetical protein
MLMKDKGVDFVAAVAVNFATTRGHRKNFRAPSIHRSFHKISTGRLKPLMGTKYFIQS